MYKRIAGEGYKLKLNASRKAFGEIIKKYPSLPFNLRNLVNNARMGLPECVNHDLLQPYPVLYEKPNALVAQFKATVLLLPNGSDRVTSAAVQEIKSEKQVSHLSLMNFSSSLQIELTYFPGLSKSEGVMELMRGPMQCM